MTNNISTEQLIYFLLYLVLIGVFIAIWAQSYSIYYQQEKRAIAVWQKFAQDNNLKFKPSNLFNWDVEVKGIYRNYYLEFYTSRHKDNSQESEQKHSWARYNRPSRTQITVSPDTYFCTNALITYKQQEITTDTSNLISSKESISTRQLLDLLIPSGLVCSSRKNVKIKIKKNKISYKHEGFERNQHYLSKLANMLCELAKNQAKIVALGGEAIPAIKTLINNNNHPLKLIALNLAQTIAKQSKALQEKNPKLLCPSCLAYFVKQQINISLNRTIHYYGCPLCYQNRKQFSGNVIVVIDKQMTEKKIETDNELKVNWLLYEKLFDFDTIEIGQASDEDVEQFAIEVGNDTHKIRKLRYSKMICKLLPESQLSENTKRILQHIFGQLETLNN